jgi:lysophospholipase L1-like esterase
MADVYGVIGEGFISSARDPDTSRFTLTGSPTINSYSVLKSALTLNTTAKKVEFDLTLNRTSPGFTEIDVYTYDGSSGTLTVESKTGAGSYGALTDLSNTTNDGTSYAWTKTTYTGFTTETHLRLTGKTGSVIVGGIVVRNRTTGIVVNRMGKAGDTSQNLYPNDAATTALTTDQRVRFRRSFQAIGGASLVVCMMGYNDAGNQADAGDATQSQPGTSPDQYAVNMQAFCDDVVAMGACVLLVGEVSGPSGFTPYGLTDYRLKGRQIAENTDHVAYVDAMELFGDYPTMQALGMTNTSSVHMKSPGHGLLGGSLAEVLLRPLPIK